ncbi:hypothetical protein [Kribbella sp. NBC_00889]|uniref:hypothetical protein n=1 Tax=Kribbella sp. NBC_00889 TaxID=2975974 RepID=UPI00386F245E|nr:hypothetical protein OG817_31605 [Kribbella sp. NBC_00889]
MKKLTIALAVAACAFGGVSGVQVLAGQQAPAATSGQAAAIHCDMAFDFPDPAKSGSRVTRDSGRLIVKATGSGGLVGNTVSRATADAPLELALATDAVALPFKKTCSGGDPLDVEWQQWFGDKHLDDAWFLNSPTSQTAMFSGEDPMGLRTFNGVVGSSSAGQDITFNQLAIDLRWASSLTHSGAIKQPDNSYQYWLSTGKYDYPNSRDGYEDWPNVPIFLETRCGTGQWTAGPQGVTDAEGMWKPIVKPATCGTAAMGVRVRWSDSPDVWGSRVTFAYEGGYADLGTVELY